MRLWETSCAPCTAEGACSNCISCCCSSAHQCWRQSRLGTGIKVEYFSSAWMGVEAVGSIIVGLMAGSLALLAFGGERRRTSLGGGGLAPPAKGLCRPRDERQANCFRYNCSAFRYHSDNWTRSHLLLSDRSKARGIGTRDCHRGGRRYHNAVSMV